MSLCAGNSPVPVNSLQRPVARSFDVFFALRLNWINGWVNNREAGDLRRHRGHYSANVMWLRILEYNNTKIVNINTKTICVEKHNEDF